MSLREQILSAPAAASEQVDVPGWNATVEVRPLSLKAKADVYRDGVDGDEPAVEKLYPALVIASVFDPVTGKPVFTKADAEWLADQPGGAVELLAQKALGLSGFTKKPAEEG